MIPRSNITAWRRTAPWPDNMHVEQDLILSRAIVEIFERPGLTDRVAFRGGTALHKLFFDPPGRYSEDIDLVQREPGPIGPLIDEIRSALDPWLGGPRWKASHGRFTLYYRFETTFSPTQSMRVKIEINTREHFSVLGFARRRFTVTNPWFSGATQVATYTLPELLATKLRALYQRKKGRDLFDLANGLDHALVDTKKLVSAFEEYMDIGGTPATRAQIEANLDAKMRDAAFLGDMTALLRTGLEYDPAEAWSRVHERIVTLLPGAPWKGTGGA